MRILLIIIFLLICSCATEKTKPAQQKKDCWAPVRLAVKFRASGEYQQSIDALQEFNKCDLEPNEEPGMAYYYHLGWTYYEMGEYKKAIVAYTKGLESQPDYVGAYWRRGLSYEKLGETLKAEEDFRLAFEAGMKGNSKEFLESLEKNPEIKEKLVKQK